MKDEAFRKKHKAMLLLAVAVLSLTVGCVIPEPPPDSHVWANYNPVQCNGNPWEEWYAFGAINYVTEPTQEQLITDYYSIEHGVQILEVVIYPPPPGTVVCEACNCPRGETVQAKIFRKDMEKMESLGWYFL